MNIFAYRESKRAPYFLIIIAYAMYMAVLALYHERLGIGVAALAIFPVIAASWYFGITAGVLTALLSVLANVVIIIAPGGTAAKVFENPADVIGTFVLLFIGVMIGRIGTITRERREALLKLEKYEEERRSHTEFLERLNSITSRALEADSLPATLNILVEKIGQLFEADDSYFSLWDETRGVPVPVAASGSMRDIYPFVQFEPGDQTLTSSVMEAQQPIAIPDIENTPYMSPKIALIFPDRSMLGLPFIAQHRNLGALLLGYRKPHSFGESDLMHARATSEQVALVVSKSLLLEEERKQVKQLTALHDISLIAIDVDNEDELIVRVTDIIGQNLFPDNFGILLLDEQAEILRFHPSYRFFSVNERHLMDVPLDKGIAGKVARTGKAERIENVRRVKEYIDIDERTVSELCVPIKFKERILGVINAESTKWGAFTEDDERLLITLAGQIATAIEQIRKAQAERKWLDQLAHSNDLIYALAQITTHIEKAFSIDDIIRNLGTELNRINLTCIMAVYDQERALFTVNYTSLAPTLLELVENRLGHPLIAYTFSRDRLKLENILYPTALSSMEAEIQMLSANTRGRGILEILGQIGVEAETEPLRLPLVFEENLLGILWVWGKGLTRADLPIMSIFAKQIGVSLERARLFQEVQSLALTDPLTGLQNRRSLFELGRVEFARAQRMQRPFCCMMLDLDHFKQVNDKYGHAVGDQVLQEFAKRCSNSVREVDLVGRYGGEELIILLPETDRPTSLQVAERLRSTIADTPIKIFDKEISVTASIGVATQDENTMDLETLIARADQAMYIAKHKGRNRVAISK
ncbi:MAG TPA: diguanylate cyclase [Anaerolineales bacterium]|nr:diguanylate cyclase [Anaerolineales bacterium]